MNAQNKVYFSNLDALRFFAFLSVFVAHAWAVYVPGFYITSFTQWLRDFSKVGVLGVNFFFVLSGFLIFYLLFSERERTGRNNILKFYARRTLRIWPLYFGIVLFSFYAVPLLFSFLGKDYHETAHVYSYLLFFANFEMMKGIIPYSPMLAVLWSIAIEEQFYLFCPVLFKLFFKKIQWVFLLMIIFSIAFRAAYIHNERIIYLHTFSILSDFAIGGLTAYLSFYRNKLFHTLIALSKQWIIVIYLFIMVILCGYNFFFQSPFSVVVERAILGVMFSFIIFEQTFCTHSFFKAGNIEWFSWLGKISYGLYCFHPLALKVSKDMLRQLNFLNQPVQYMIVLPALALVLTIAVSGWSYNYYEKWFLQWKEKFSFR